MIYKYYPSNCYTCDALTKGYFFFNKAAKQNDPYDTSFKLIQSEFLLRELGFQFDGTKNRVESIMKEYGSCCFSEERNNKHLWSFYASNYQGIVIGFDENTFWNYYNQLQARIHYVKVDYIDTPINDNVVVEEGKSFQLRMPLYEKNEPESDWLKPHKFSECITDAKKSEILFTYLCCIKERITWGEEKESRLIAALDVIKGRERLERMGIEYLPSGYKIPMPKNCIKEIIVGHDFDMTKSHLIEIIAKKYDVKQIFQTKAENPFKIELDDITKRFNL